MPCTISDRRSRLSTATRSLSAPTELVLLERAQTRIAELETANVRLLEDLKALRKVQTPSPLALLSGTQLIWLALSALGVSLFFLFFVLARR